MNQLRIHDVPTELLSDFWPLVSEMLQRAVIHNPHMDLADVFQLISGDMGQLVVAIEAGELVAAAVMERVHYPKRVVGNILLLAGKPGTMGARLDRITEHVFSWAKTRGCDRIALIGLPGLSRVVKRHGGQSIALIHAWRDL